MTRALVKVGFAHIPGMSCRAVDRIILQIHKNQFCSIIDWIWRWDGTPHPPPPPPQHSGNPNPQRAKSIDLCQPAQADTG